MRGFLVSRSVCAALAAGCFLLTSVAGDITGTVTEQGSGTPLGGIDIDVFDSNLQAVATAASTDGAGNYSVTGLPAGNYVVRADPNVAQGYVDQYNSGVFLKSQAPFVSVPGAGSVVADFSLFLGATISGRITVAVSGTPTVGIDIDVFEQTTGELISSVNASTDGAGDYTIGAFPPGTYVLRADPAPSDFFVERYYFSGESRSTADPIAIVGTADANGIDFELEPGGIIQGEVADAGSSAPLAGVDLDLFDATGAFQRYGSITSATGAFTIGPVPPGNYFVRADPDPLTGYVRTYYPDQLFESNATLVTVAANSITSSVDIGTPAGGTLGGRVVETGTLTPLLGIDIDVFDATGARVPVNAKTDALGDYLLGALPAGDYTVRADPTLAQGYASEYYDSVFFQNLATPVTVAVGTNTPGVDLELDPGGLIQGIVTETGSGAPLAGIDIDIFDASGEFYSTVGAITSATGYYRVGPLPPGNWIVEADPTAGQGYADEFYDGEFASFRATPVAVAGGAVVSNIDIALDPGGFVSGTIRSRVDNLPLAGIDLDVFFTDGRRIQVNAITAGNGTYTLGILPAGDYLIRADPPLVSGIPRQYYDNSPDRPSALPVTVSVGQTTFNIDFLLGEAVSGIDRWRLYE